MRAYIRETRAFWVSNEISSPSTLRRVRLMTRESSGPKPRISYVRSAQPAAGASRGHALIMARFLQYRTCEKRIGVPGVQPRHVAPAAPVRALLLCASVRNLVAFSRRRVGRAPTGLPEKTESLKNRCFKAWLNEAGRGVLWFIFFFFFITQHKVLKVC